MLQEYHDRWFRYHIVLFSPIATACTEKVYVASQYLSIFWKYPKLWPDNNRETLSCCVVKNTRCLQTNIVLSYILVWLCQIIKISCPQFCLHYTLYHCIYKVKFRADRVILLLSWVKENVFNFSEIMIVFLFKYSLCVIAFLLGKSIRIGNLFKYLIPGSYQLNI